MHTCSYYCQGTVHALEVLATLGSLAEHTAALRILMAARGYTLLHVRFAPEADLAAWEARATRAGYVKHEAAHFCDPTTTDGTPQFCLLAFVETAPPSTEDPV